MFHGPHVWHRVQDPKNKLATQRQFQKVLQENNATCPEEIVNQNLRQKLREQLFMLLAKSPTQTSCKTAPKLHDPACLHSPRWWPHGAKDGCQSDHLVSSQRKDAEIYAFRMPQSFTWSTAWSRKSRHAYVCSDTAPEKGDALNNVLGKAISHIALENFLFLCLDLESK